MQTREGVGMLAGKGEGASGKEVYKPSGEEMRPRLLHSRKSMYREIRTLRELLSSSFWRQGTERVL
jgi:hypothetical protein